MPRKVRVKLMEPKKPAQALVIYQFIQDKNRTCNDLVVLTGFRLSTVSARLAELKNAGCIRFSGEDQREGQHIQAIVPGRTYLDFMRWQYLRRSRKGPSKTRLVQACQQAYDHIKAGGPARDRALRAIGVQILRTFEEESKLTASRRNEQ